jgi:phosphoserine phosphatase RsbU/P
MRTLIADDNADNRTLLMDLLPKWGHEVVSATDGQEAWRVLADKNAPQLAILDWVMPGINGVELCRRLRERERQNHPYIILLTSRCEAQDIVRALEAGADDYVTKPFNIDELRARIQAGCRILDLQAQLRDHERLQGVLQMAGAVCHEMNQPLQIVMASSELLMPKLSPDDPNYKVLVMLKEGVERLGQVTRRVMRITHSRTRNYLGEPDRIIDLTRPVD